MGFIIGTGVFMILILLISNNSHDSAFDDQLCGYCDFSIHWNKGQGRWIHKNGQLQALNTTRCSICRLVHSELSHNASPLRGQPI